MGKTDQMDDANRAVCYALRNPPREVKKIPLKDIRKLVWKKDGRTHPTLQGISGAAAAFKATKQLRGRKKGQRATTKEEDKIIMAKFHKLRPPGHGIDSNTLHRALPQKIKKKVGRRVVIRRLAEKGYTPQMKFNKSDFSVLLRKRRLTWCKKHENKDRQAWKNYVQAVGDVKEFTWYPRELQARFKKYRAPWTYMTPAERIKPDFQRPKKWFPKKDWKKVRKQKVFGFTASNGKQLAFLVPSPWSTEIWAGLIKSKMVPWLKRSFPGRQEFRILLDSEPLLHGPAAKAVFRQYGISIEPGWPKYSADLNPQENIWSQAEP